MPRGLTLILLVILAAVLQTASGRATSQTHATDASAAAADEAFRQLLYLPAPTPRTKQTEESQEAHGRTRPPHFYDEDKPPPDGRAASEEDSLDVDDEQFPSHLNTHLAEANAGGFYVLAADLSVGGLWKMYAGRKPVRVSGGEGVYADPVVTPDGVWAVAAKADSDWGRPNGVVRFNLKTSREYRVELPPADQFEPVAYVAAQGKVLLRRARDDADQKESGGPAAPEFYLLDAATGRAQLVNGVFAPLLQDGSRPLQPTGNADEFWAAVPDGVKDETRVGRYSTKDFSFRAVLAVPHIRFDSYQAWVNEAGARLYVVYEGQLLRLPVPKGP